MALVIGTRVIVKPNGAAGTVTAQHQGVTGVYYTVEYHKPEPGCVFGLNGVPYSLFFERDLTVVAVRATGLDNVSVACAGCGEHNEYAQANCPDGNFVCWGCRNGAEAWRWAEAGTKAASDGYIIFRCQT